MTDKELEEFIYVGENNFIELAMIFGSGWASTALQIATEHRAMLAQPEKEWVGLTDDEISECAMQGYASEMAKAIITGIVKVGDANIQIAKAVEAKLKEKNT